MDVIRDFKLDVLTIISQHEHWLPLCLPVVIDSQNQIQRVVNQPLYSDWGVTSGPSSRFLPRFLNQVFQPSASSIDKHRCNDFHILFSSNVVLSFLILSDATCSEEWYLNATYVSHHFPSGIIFQHRLGNLCFDRIGFHIKAHGWANARLRS
ncbi:hypothetical protein COOONC_28321 [Cooperia oncophora]